MLLTTKFSELTDVSMMDNRRIALRSYKSFAIASGTTSSVIINVERKGEWDKLLLYIYTYTI